MKTPKFDGNTNLEAALDIMPVDGDVYDFVPSANELDNDIYPNNELVTVDDSDLNGIDDIDTEIHDDIQQVYDAALDAFNTANDDVASLEPKYIARAMEVNKQYLDVALSAASLKQRQKEHADKMKIQKIKLSDDSIPPKTVNNTLIVTDRNSALKLAKDMRNKNKGNVDE